VTTTAWSIIALHISISFITVCEGARGEGTAWATNTFFEEPGEVGIATGVGAGVVVVLLLSSLVLVPAFCGGAGETEEGFDTSSNSVLNVLAYQSSSPSGLGDFTGLEIPEPALSLFWSGGGFPASVMVCKQRAAFCSRATRILIDPNKIASHAFR
jgi:hypothetical protein